MIIADLWKPKPRREAKNRHVWRPRKENFGEMQQFDGSYHHWFENRGEESCLLLAIDDATGRITHAKFDHNEGTKAVFHFWLEYFNRNGIPISIYLDRFSSYKINHKSAEDNKDLITQFQRAAKEIGMNLITAYSPEAKGRVERVFETLQDRLVKELRLKNISTIEEANKFLNKEFIDKFNAKFAVIPALKSNLHQSVKSLKEEKLLQIFSIQNKRRVNNDYTILFKNQFFPVYLFAGQRGCGKTSTARIFAAAVNCARLPEFQQDPRKVSIPCLLCESCVAMSKGQHPDFIEIDAASHTGVDNVRNIIDASSFLPLLSSKKIYLIDEAHMLSKAAFNAFLKIMEEPPASVIFILATTDMQKILDTVKSRCFQIFFDPVDVQTISDHLEKLCIAESIAFDAAGLSVIAKEAGGSVRDAINLLEQTSKTCSNSLLVFVGFGIFS